MDKPGTEKNYEIRLFIPLKTTIIKTKKIGGPYIRIKHQYVLALALVVAGSSYRWEPYLVIDRLDYLGKEGVSAIAGPLALIKYNGRNNLISIARECGMTSIYVPPWKFPLLFAFERDALDESELLLLDKAGLSNAKRFLNKIIKYIKIIEA